MTNTSVEPQGKVELYWTPALPMHYIAQDRAGNQWMIPVSPISPSVWTNAKPYQGNYELERVRPPAIERFYQPDADNPAMTVAAAAEKIGVKRQYAYHLADTDELEEWTPPVDGFEDQQQRYVTRASVQEFIRKRTFTGAKIECHVHPVTWEAIDPSGVCAEGEGRELAECADEKFRQHVQGWLEEMFIGADSIELLSDCGETDQARVWIELSASAARKIIENRPDDFQYTDSPKDDLELELSDEWSEKLRYMIDEWYNRGMADALNECDPRAD